jgi:hypothetical protein
VYINVKKAKVAVHADSLTCRAIKCAKHDGPEEVTKSDSVSMKISEIPKDVTYVKATWGVTGPAGTGASRRG